MYCSMNKQYVEGVKKNKFISLEKVKCRHVVLPFPGRVCDTSLPVQRTKEKAVKNECLDYHMTSNEAPNIL